MFVIIAFFMHMTFFSMSRIFDYFFIMLFFPFFVHMMNAFKAEIQKQGKISRTVQLKYAQAAAVARTLGERIEGLTGSTEFVNSSDVPEWRAVWTNSWEKGDFSASWLVNAIGRNGCNWPTRLSTMIRIQHCYRKKLGNCTKFIWRWRQKN